MSLCGTSLNTHSRPPPQRKLKKDGVKMETQEVGVMLVWVNEAENWKTDPLTDVKIPLQRPHPRDLRVKNPSGSVTPTRTLYARTPRYVFGGF